MYEYDVGDSFFKRIVDSRQSEGTLAVLWTGIAAFAEGDCPKGKGPPRCSGSRFPSIELRNWVHAKASVSLSVMGRVMEIPLLKPTCRQE